MGCGESKHDVAAGNTITRKQSDVGSSSRGKNLEPAARETSPQVSHANMSVQNKEKEIASKEYSSKEAVARVQDVNVAAVAGAQAANVEAVAIVQDANENEGSKVGRKDVEKKEESAVAKQEPEKLISEESPNDVVSSTKDEDIKEGIASEGSSEKKEISLSNESAGKLDDVAKETLVEETKQEEENEEPQVVKQENAKEAVKTDTTVDEPVASPTNFEPEVAN